MPPSPAHHATLEDWVAREAIAFSLDSTEQLNAAVDRMIAALGDSVSLLGLGEAMHGSEEFLSFRNRFFQRLVQKHGFSAIAIESSFPRGRAVNEYVAGRGGRSYDAVQEGGFSHGFGKWAANRELIEWMRSYNARSPEIPLRFYGFDGPLEMTVADSPRALLHFTLDYLGSIDPASAAARRETIDALLGQDADWENPAAAFDPGKSIGLSPAAASLRIKTEDLITELEIRRPELVAKSDGDRWREAAQHAAVARQLLNYHAGMAGTSPTRIADLLGIRDAMMADNLAYMELRERGRGRVLAFAHNGHLQRGIMKWQLGPNALEWWPAGAHLGHTLGSGYAVIGSAIGTSEAHGIAPPETGTLEAYASAGPGSARLVPTHPARPLPPTPTRSGSSKNSTYFPLTSQALSDFDWLAVLT